MHADQIKITDIGRLLFGEAPAAFLIEVAVRAICTYLLLLVTTRLMGRRVAGQMGLMELTIVVTLGAAIGVPLQAPDRGLLPAVVILCIAIVYQRGLNFWSFLSRRAELLVQGDVSTLIADGRLELKELAGAVISRERLFAVLRQEGVIHLGQVKRAYLEADGHFSVYQNEKPTPGLCILAGTDKNAFEEGFHVPNAFACRSCGQVADDPKLVKAPCGRCGEQVWSMAVEKSHLDEL